MSSLLIKWIYSARSSCESIKMVHWAFLILAFIAGFASCYGLLWHLAKMYGRVVEAIKAGAKVQAGY